tara:strand:+ start:363 stop:716 length:354 start_codon:yes stop_codon:yes gene_type:complete
MENLQHENVRFYNKKVEESLASFDETTITRFVTQLEMVSWGATPTQVPKELKHTVGPGAFELKRNGKPAKRCIYVIEEQGKVLVLHVFKKTCDGVDRKNMATAKKRYKAWKKSQQES